MTRQEMMDYTISNWGFEDWRTIELFRMEERGESNETMAYFIKIMDGPLDDFGFEN